MKEPGVRAAFVGAEEVADELLDAWLLFEGSESDDEQAAIARLEIKAADITTREERIMDGILRADSAAVSTSGELVAISSDKLVDDFDRQRYRSKAKYRGDDAPRATPACGQTCDSAATLVDSWGGGIICSRHD